MLRAAQYSKKGAVDFKESDWFVTVIVELGLDFSVVGVEMDVSVHITNDYQLLHHQIILK